MRAMIGSGTETPNRFSFIQRADFAERIGPTPMMTPSFSVMPSARKRSAYARTTSRSKPNCVWMKSAPASIFFCSGTGDHFASGLFGTSAAPMKNCSGDEIARERDAIAIAARDLEDRLVAVRDEDRCGCEARDRRLAGRGVRQV